MKKVIYLLCSLMPLLLDAQNNGQGKGLERLLLPTTPRRYYTQKNYQRLLTIDPDMARKRAFLDMQLNLNTPPLTADVTIPVVVHLLYKAGTNTNSLPKESDIRQQLDIVSKDFRQTVAQKKHLADDREHFAVKNGLDTRISFCLASKTPTGASTTGILTVPTAVTTWLADDKMKSATTGGSTAWDTEKYLNVWIVNFPDSISGYAQMPAGPAATDGIVIDYRYFGKKPNNDKTFPYTEGETMTHLMGSYLNLYELWSETVLCGDDGVEDTPIQNAPTLGKVDYRFVSTCDGNPVVMSMNFMDNSNDEMSYMFTNGQKKRLQATLATGGIRYGLVQSGATQCTNPVQSLANTKMLLDIDAAAEFEKARISWVNNTGKTNDYFEVQKLNISTNTFEKQEVMNTRPVEGNENYIAYDTNPIDGENIYRIKLVSNDGKEYLSAQKTVLFQSSGIMTLFPNPADDILNIALKGYTGQAVDITLFDIQGKPVLTKHIDHWQNDVQTLVLTDVTHIGQYLVLVKSKGKRDVVRRFSIGK